MRLFEIAINLSMLCCIAALGYILTVEHHRAASTTIVEVYNG